MVALINSRFSRTISLLITIFSLSFPAYAKYSGGTGEPNNPYKIATTEDLMLLGETPDDYDKHFILTSNIDLDPKFPFDGPIIDLFHGIFDGNDHTISNLTIIGEGPLGLFGKLTHEACVMDLGIVDINIVGRDNIVGRRNYFKYVGGLVGINWGSVTSSYSTGSISRDEWINYVGGLVGINWGSITSSYSTCVVSGDWEVGGLVGYNDGSVTSSYSTGSVSGDDERVGGLVGRNWGSITLSYSTGAVSGDDAVGGLAGGNWGSITSSYSTGSVSGNDYIGGLVGYNYHIVTSSYSAGSVSGYDYIGGLVGYNYWGSITSSFWDTEVSGLTESAGESIGLTTPEMQTKRTFLDAGWDFVGETVNGQNDIWKMWNGFDYPRLSWEPGPNTPLVFVDINDPNFYGQMSKYEVTNAQYCDFLNAALASGDITVDSNDVYGESGSNGGEDYAGQRYYRCDGSGYTGYGATNGGASRIHYSEGSFSVDDGFDNHPVTYVSWYGAMAFANYYGYYLPAEEQWQAVADYDGTFIYGCGQIIEPGIANYRVSEHPDGTTPVGSFGIYGYGMSNMAGNVWEWTSSSLDNNRVFRGGSMGSVDSDCAVSIRGDGIPYANYWDIGFRVCR